MAVEITPSRAIAPRAPAGGRARWAVLLVLATAAAIVHFVGLGHVAWLQNLLIVFASLLMEAMPFILLGAAVSAAIEVLVPASAFERLGRLPKALQLPAAAAAGVAFPVCECGSVPVARRLASKGLSPAAAVTFMLAAPIVNPVVVASTFVAYRGRDTLWVMVIGRLVLGFIVAMVVGWVIGAVRGEELLKPRPGYLEVRETGEDEPRRTRFVAHFTGDVIFMARFLIVGAAIAAAVQTFVPQSIVNGVARLPVLSLMAMMARAFLMSLCSESDAFVAASFVSFGPAAQLAFLVSGPMIDMKLAALYVGTYRKGFLRAAVLAILATTLVLTLWVQVIFG